MIEIISLQVDPVKAGTLNVLSPKLESPQSEPPRPQSTVTRYSVPVQMICRSMCPNHLSMTELHPARLKP